MTREKPLITFPITQELRDRVDDVANQRFFGNRSAAIRWMLSQSLLTREVANELMAAERIRMEQDDVDQTNVSNLG